MTQYYLTTNHFDLNLPPYISNEIKDSSNCLITYDLHNTLPKIESQIHFIDEILDVQILETIVNLGKYHKRYYRSKKEIPQYGLRKYISEVFLSPPTRSTETIAIPHHFWSWLIKYAHGLKSCCTNNGVWNHYKDIEIPFSVSLYILTGSGIKIDGKKTDKIYREIGNARQKLEYALSVNNVTGNQIKDIDEWVKGYGFKEFFPAENEKITIKDLSLLEDHHQVFKIFLRLEKLNRINTFLRSIANREIIKPFYLTLGAVTGRCTSKNPNIMGLPKIFRPIVVPSNNKYGIVECDYSQMEVGVAAALSDDQNLINDYNNSDVYEKAAELLFGDSRSGSRAKAKIIFLGLQYGLSQNTLSKRLQLNQEETSRILATVFGRYRKLSAYLRKMEQFGQNLGYAESVSGLRRYRLDRNRAPDYWERNWFRNFPIQSSAASVFKKAIIRIHQNIETNRFHLLVPLHDSIVFECPLNRLQDTTKSVTDCMISSMKEYFPKLEPKVRINDTDPSCWNKDGESKSIEKLLKNPLHDIDINEKASSNVDWSQYL